MTLMSGLLTLSSASASGTARLRQGWAARRALPAVCARHATPTAWMHKPKQFLL